MSLPRFLAEGLDLGAEVVELTGPEGHHAAVVRRLRVGERVDLTDGAGTVAHGEVVGADRRGLAVRVLGRERLPEPQPRLTVAQALAKSGRGELAVELLTEVGVDGVLAWQAARCVERWTAERAPRGLERWRSTAREAAKQSRRARVPQVDGPVDTGALAAAVAGADLAVVLHEEAAAPLAGLSVPGGGEVLLVVGPEGGIEPAELDRLTAAGAHTARLGDTVLRTSTAGAAAAAVVLAATARWGPRAGTGPAAT